jgi:hypothetical protein
LSGPRSVAIAAATLLIIASGVDAQDTTQAYPWRLSYFPYVTAEPGNGVMAVARITWFQQSRWDARTSVDRQVAVDAGYSTRDTWLLRAEADMHRLAPGWRLQVVAQADRERLAALSIFGFRVGDPSELWSRQSAEVELTRRIFGPVALAARGGWVRATSVVEGHPEDNETQVEERGRIAIVVDLRDREYDTRSGALLQGGVIMGSSHGTYRGGYVLASGWLPVGPATRFTARAGYRAYGEGSGTPDAWRTVPAWEDEFVVGGGFQSNRTLPPAFDAGRRVILASAEGRHDLFTFPGGALAVLAFVDGARAGQESIAFTASTDVAERQSRSGPLEDWIVGAGGGVSLRLLRNAVLTATVGAAQGKARMYVSSGWAW